MSTKGLKGTRTENVFLAHLGSALVQWALLIWFSPFQNSCASSLTVLKTIFHFPVHLLLHQKNGSHKISLNLNIFKRPGEAGAVLQTPP